MSEDLRTLVVGGGVAGLTLASLMQQRGQRPWIIERQEQFDDLGYKINYFSSIRWKG